MRFLEIGQALLILVYARLEFLQLNVEPIRRLRRCLQLRLAVLPVIGVDQRMTTAAERAASPDRKRISMSSVLGRVCTWRRFSKLSRSHA